MIFPEVLRFIRKFSPAFLALESEWHLRVAKEIIENRKRSQVTFFFKSLQILERSKEIAFKYIDHKIGESNVPAMFYAVLHV